MRVRVAAIVICLVALGGTRDTASAQGTYELLRSFLEPAYPPTGRLLEVPTGRLFGVARSAGPFGKGALFAYDRQPDGTLTSTVIHAFNGADGALPMGGVILGTDGALYGTTSQGGAENRGTVFRLGPDNSFSVLHSFTSATGEAPVAQLVQAADGHLYGTTSDGIAAGIFRITTAGALTVLHVFESSSAAQGLTDPLVEAEDGALYGAERFGGLTSETSGGTVFRITPAGEFTVIHRFSNPGPANPTTFIDGGDGFFYGATSNTNRDSAPSTIFRISPAGAFTQLYTTGTTQPGVRDIHLIRGADGNFYGTTEIGGSAGQGTLFRMTPAGAVTTLYSFSYSTGAYPNAIVQTADGNLFGSTADGGYSRRGVIFRSTTSGQYQAAHMFTGTDPLMPMSNLVAGTDGALYGASCLGGAFNVGTVFRVMPDGSNLTVLHSFAYWDGGCPRGALTLGHDGALYGATTYYGLGGRGTLFKVTTTGSFSPLYFFSGGAAGANPYSGILRASDGNYYGTTHAGGTLGGGTIFRLSPAGALTTVHQFDGSGSFTTSFAEAPLMQHSDGNIYGATLTRPFRLTLAGAVTLFDAVGIMRGSLAQGPDGNLYGTTGNTGIGPVGTIFRMTPAGVSTTIHTFTGPDGSALHAGLLLAPDATFYGSTGSGGANDRGTLFQFFGAGAPITLHSFNGADGAVPFARLTLGADGALYGSTMIGGQGDRGALFRLVRP